MTVIALGSAKASPGVTTTMLALAAAWPPNRALLLVEADCDGGVLAARSGLRLEPGLTTLAAAARRTLDTDELVRQAQTLPGGLPVLLGPADPDEARRAWEMAGGRLAAAMAGLTDRDVLVDCGRLRRESPSLPLVEQADVVVVVARPRLDELQHLAPRLRALQAARRRTVLLLVGDRPYPPKEVASAMGVPMVGVIADDARAASVLTGRGGGEARLRRSLLIRSAREVIDPLLTLACESCESPVSASGSSGDTLASAAWELGRRDPMGTETHA